ncbi:MAG: carboxypeptidase regulatory-like domain-containing protein [Methanomassiliicoccus sp.]|nr:carboxypeptidase regulatory-like domain-containing protein [Methanomassiliicoccus sp.]
MDDYGNAIATWVNDNIEGMHIFASIYNRTTDSWGAETRLSVPFTSVAWPQVTMSHLGDAEVTWSQYDTYWTVYSVSYQHATDTWEATTAVSDGSAHAESPHNAMNAAGDAVTIWRQKSGSDYLVYASVFNHTRGTWGTPSQISGTGFYWGTYVAMDPRGNVVAVWYNTDGDSRVHTCVYNYTADAWSPATVLPAGSSTYGQYPQVAMNSSGDAVVVWGNGSPSVVDAATYNHITGTWGEVTTISSDDYVYYPQVAVNDGGAVMVVWEQRNASSGSHGIYATMHGFFSVLPSIDITYPGNPGEWSNKTSMNITWTADAIGGLDYCWIALDGGSWNNVTRTYYEFSGLSEGHHNVTIRVYDPSGDYSEVNRTFNVETSNPELSISSPAPDSSIPVPFVGVAWSASSASGIDNYWVKVDDGSWTDVGSDTFYSISSPTNGAHTVYVKAEDHAGNWNTTSVSFTVGSAPASKGTINGTLVDGNGNAIAGATVTISNGGSASTDSNGYFSFANVTSGSYTLTVTKDGYVTITRTIVVTAGQTTALGSISGESSSSAAVIAHSPSGDDVPRDAVISVEFSGAMNESSVTVSINDIACSVSWSGNVITCTSSSNLEFGKAYTVTVAGKDLIGNSVEYSWAFTTLKDEGMITGKLTCANGDPIVGATVTLSNGMTTTTDSNGYFSFANVTSGSYTLTVTKDGYEKMTQTVTASAGQTTSLGSLRAAETIASGSGDASLVPLMGGALIIVIVLAGFLILVYRRNKKEDEK